MKGSKPGSVQVKSTSPKFISEGCRKQPIALSYWYVGPIGSLRMVPPGPDLLIRLFPMSPTPHPPLTFSDDTNRREHQPFVSDKAGRLGLLRVLTAGLGSASKKCEAGSTETAGAERVQVVDWEGYRKIDRDEVARGATKGKPREKLVDITQMLKIAGADGGE